jgi:hypothetical protein
MNIALSDRRVSPRHSFKLPLRIRIWKSAIPEQRTESENLSERERERDLPPNGMAVLWPRGSHRAILFAKGQVGGGRAIRLFMKFLGHQGIHRPKTHCAWKIRREFNWTVWPPQKASDWRNSSCP